MPEAGVPPAMRNQPEEDRRPREDGSWENYVSKRLSSAYVIAVLRMPGAQAAPRDILLAPRTVPFKACMVIGSYVLFIYKQTNKKA